MLFGVLTRASAAFVAGSRLVIIAMLLAYLASIHR